MLLATPVLGELSKVAIVDPVGNRNHFLLLHSGLALVLAEHRLPWRVATDVH